MLGREFCRGLIVQCAVRPLLVVVSAPSGDQDTSLLQARKPVVIQALIPEASVEILDEDFAMGHKFGPGVIALKEQFRLMISKSMRRGFCEPAPPFCNSSLASLEKGAAPGN